MKTACVQQRRGYASSECERASYETHVFAKVRTSGLYLHKKHICAHLTDHRCVFHCLVMASIVFIKSLCLAHHQTTKFKCRGLYTLRKGVFGVHIKRMASFHTLHETQIRYAH